MPAIAWRSCSSRRCAFYAALFGAIKRGAIAVPLFTLFGPDGIKLRVDDCTPKLLLTNAEKAETARALTGLDVVVADDRSWPRSRLSRSATTRAARPTISPCSSTRRGPRASCRRRCAIPSAAIVALMVAALYGTGIRPGDRFFCPSSPAWGHGLWHGTLAPLALGVTTGTMAGKFDPVRMLRALAAIRRSPTCPRRRRTIA